MLNQEEQLRALQGGQKALLAINFDADSRLH